ncbi:UDP-N-acetylmuramate--L-alanine ligase [Penaeicola halotolerans]|uniref:UDP-N-acetylmuramate--L-alanine ligase n=1 Tax=Penaeicola halotolerans TaxID=2793196 RepID=UPI001CF8F072|nr:UDP-N-acetylmuramate--L-alanine ligase [Penaeicola halotolerans]
MRLEQLHSVYFLGIGGIGMSALARWFMHRGMAVYGYDKTPTKLTDQLISEGMKIHFDDQVSLIAEDVKSSDKESVLVIYTPAIPKDHQEWAFFREHGYVIKKRAEVLGLITQSLFAVGVAGTHGKTTTSSMVAHLLKVGGVNVSAFLGGITQNYHSNLLIHEEGLEEAVAVIEADEFDRSFLHLHPNISVITAVDPDHLDIYGDDAHIVASFNDYAQLTSAGGELFISANAVSRLDKAKLGEVSIKTYGIDKGDIQAKNIQIVDGVFHFDYTSDLHQISGLELLMPGYHNVENALAAISVALSLGVSDSAIKEGISTFKGVKRRFEYVVKNNQTIYIDDYAHHPAEIDAFLKSVKAMYPNKKVTAVFQPHLFTRTRDFAAGFSESLSLADEVVLLDIYPARELPITGVTSEMLLEAITVPHQMSSKSNLLEDLKKNEIEVLVTIGAGDIDTLVLPIKNWLENK